jgi:hypothetical protein
MSPLNFRYIGDGGFVFTFVNSKHILYVLYIKKKLRYSSLFHGCIGLPLFSLLFLSSVSCFMYRISAAGVWGYPRSRKLFIFNRIYYVYFSSISKQAVKCHEIKVRIHIQIFFVVSLCFIFRKLLNVTVYCLHH